MNYRALSKLTLCAFILLFTADVSAQIGQRFLETLDREMVNVSSQSLGGGGFYAVNIFADPTFNSPDSVGINITRHDTKGNNDWSFDHVIDDATFSLVNRSVESARLAADTLMVVVSDATTEDNSGLKYLIKIAPDATLVSTQIVRDLDDSDNTKSYISNPKVLSSLDGLSINYFATHDSGDTVGIHREQIDGGFNSLVSQSYYAMTLDSLDSLMVDISITDLEMSIDSGFVLSMAIGDDNRMVGMIDLDSLGAPRQAVSFQAVDTLDFTLEFNAIAQTEDFGYVAVGFCQHEAFPRSIVVRLDSSLNVQWSRMLEMEGQNIAGDVIIADNGEIVVAGKYQDNAFNSANYAIFMDTLGEVINSASYQNEHSLFAALMSGVNPGVDLSKDNFNMTINMTTTGVPGFGMLNNFAPLWIGMDQEGGAFCDDTLTVNFIDVPLVRDTLGIRNTLLAQRDTLELQQTDFSRYNLLVLNLRDTVFCPQDPVIFTLDATQPGATGYMWSTMETTPMITVTEPGEYSATVTIGERICYILCDTTNIEQQQFPVISLGFRNDHCENRELTYTAGSSTNIAGGVIWTDVNGDTISTEPSLTVPSEPGTTFQVQIIDNCDNPADTVFTVPDLFPPDNAGIGFDASRICDEGILTLVANWDDGVQDLMAYAWGDGQTTPTIDIDVTQAGDYVVTVTDMCGHTSVAMRTISPDDFATPDHSVSIVDSAVNCDSGQPSITLTADIEDVPPLFQNAIEIEWNTGAMNTESIIITEPGTFSVTVTVCDSVRTASIDITDMLDVSPPSLDITAGEFNPGICSVPLSATGIMVSDAGVDLEFVWSIANQTGPSVDVSVPGIYSVTVTDRCGLTAEASVTVDEAAFNVGLPTVEIDPGALNGLQCGIELNAITTEGISGPIRTIEWTPFALGDRITVTEPGLYSVTVSDNCARTAEAEIMISEDQLAFPDPGVDISSVLNEECDQVLTAGVDLNGIPGLSIGSFEWNTGQADENIAVSEAGEFSVTVTDNCGNTGGATLTLDALGEDLAFPNIFFPDTRLESEQLPDGGGAFEDNNTFGPYIESCPELFGDYNLQVFNRWGKRVFETSFVDERWSGSLDNQGNRLEEEVYFWQATYNGRTDHGSVTLVRNN